MDSVHPNGGLTVWLRDGVVYFQDVEFRGAHEKYVRNELVGMRDHGQPPPDDTTVKLLNDMIGCRVYMKGKP